MPTFPTRPSQIAVIDREEYLTQRWTYRPGEHLTILGSSGSGKTELLNGLLARSATPQLQSLYLMLKPHDSTMDKFIREHGHKVVQRFPEGRRLMWWERKPPGYVVWPHGTASVDPDEDEERMAWTFIRAMHHAYNHTHRKRPVPYIVVADEGVELDELATESTRKIRVARWTNALHARGRSMGTGMWTGTQRPAGLNLKAYNGAIHLFLAREDDERNRKRFGEIGGFDPRLISATAAQLPDFHFLALRKRPGHRAICIVGP